MIVILADAFSHATDSLHKSEPQEARVYIYRPGRPVDFRIIARAVYQFEIGRHH